MGAKLRSCEERPHWGDGWYSCGIPHTTDLRGAFESQVSKYMHMHDITCSHVHARCSCDMCMWHVHVHVVVCACGNGLGNGICQGGYVRRSLHRLSTLWFLTQCLRGHRRGVDHGDS